MKFGLPPWLKRTNGAAGLEIEPQPDPVVLELVEPTEDEARNGWEAEGLTAYLAERERAQAVAILDRKPARPRWANSRYSPLRWRARA